MKTRILVTSTDLMMVQFLVPHIKHLWKKGFKIDLACSNVGNRIDEAKQILNPYVQNFFELRLQRSPLSLKNISGYKELRRIFENNRYDLVWTNEPVMSVITRLAARDNRKNGCKIVYMAHGFHFFKGAPLLNWVAYYPIERIMAKYTDVLICVNKEDFKRGFKFGIEKVIHIHGIGINTERLSVNTEKRTDIRRELGLTADDHILLSIGELNRNKNHKVIIKAIASLINTSIHYVICGKGVEEIRLKRLADELGIADQVHFLGYRKDVVDICSNANIYVMPSFREGLPVSSLEAMYCGLPLVTSNIRGLCDVNKEGINGFLCSPTDIKAFADKIDYLYRHPEICTEMGRRNQKDVIPYTLDNTLPEVEKIISSL